MQICKRMNRLKFNWRNKPQRIRQLLNAHTFFWLSPLFIQLFIINHNWCCLLFYSWDSTSALMQNCPLKQNVWYSQLPSITAKLLFWIYNNTTVTNWLKSYMTNTQCIRWCGLNRKLKFQWCTYVWRFDLYFILLNND